jgi:hypothetical protein
MTRPGRSGAAAASDQAQPSQRGTGRLRDAAREPAITLEQWRGIARRINGPEIPPRLRGEVRRHLEALERDHWQLVAAAMVRTEDDLAKDSDAVDRLLAAYQDTSLAGPLRHFLESAEEARLSAKETLSEMGTRMTEPPGLGDLG